MGIRGTGHQEVDIRRTGEQKKKSKIKMQKAKMMRFFAALRMTLLDWIPVFAGMTAMNIECRTRNVEYRSEDFFSKLVDLSRRTVEQESRAGDRAFESRNS